jgi:hypothetical protein
MVAIDHMVMQRTSLRRNICRLQRICVGGNRGHMQQTIVGGNNIYCNQNQWLSIILSQRGEFE